MIDTVSHEDPQSGMGCRQLKVDPVAVAPVGE